jgi:tRNA(fMet)-specific endonuclease VapC
MIAATAISNDLAVHTCNPADFDGIDGLTVVAVPYPGRSISTEAASST